MQLKLFLLAIIAFSIGSISCTTRKDKPAPLKEAKISQEIMNSYHLILVLDFYLTEGRVSECGLSRDEAMKTLAQLQSWKRETIDDLVTEFTQSQTTAPSSWKDCRLDCSCGLYLSVMERIPEGFSDASLAIKVRAGATDLTTQERRECAKRFQSSCLELSGK